MDLLLVRQHLALLGGNGVPGDFAQGVVCSLGKEVAANQLKMWKRRNVLQYLVHSHLLVAKAQRHRVQADVERQLH